jgi:hypothetical protein
VATAWSAAASWRRGGVEDDGRGPFLPRQQGALSLGVRVEGAGIDDPVRDRRPRGRVYTAGIAWRPRAFLLLMGNLVHERGAGAPGSVRSRTSAAARLQVEVPGPRDPQ